MVTKLGSMIFHVLMLRSSRRFVLVQIQFKTDQQIAKHTFGPLSRMIIQISHTKGLLIVLAFFIEALSVKGLG